ncbi:MAG: heme exporter protein CcmD [Methyloceanibacter sp.]
MSRALAAMPDLGPHAVFIWAAYGVTVIAVAALSLLIVQDNRRQRRILAELKRQGITRRSAKPPAAKPLAASPRVAKPPAAKPPKARQAKAPSRKPRP